MQNKQRNKALISLTALALVILGGSVYGLNSRGIAKVHAQAPIVHVQAGNKTGQEAEIKDSVTNGKAESAVEKETTDGPGGHQDTTGANVDHQFI